MLGCQRPRQPGAEQAIDQNFAVALCSWIKHLAAIKRAGILRRRCSWFSRSNDRHFPATLAQHFCNHPAIAAVVAGTGEHRNGPSARNPPDPFRRAAPGGLHQGIDAGIYLHLSRAHLRHGEDLVTAAGHRP
jgi:hypothetical protein